MTIGVRIDNGRSAAKLLGPGPRGLMIGTQAVIPESP